MNLSEINTFSGIRLGYEDEYLDRIMRQELEFGGLVKPVENPTASVDEIHTAFDEAAESLVGEANKILESSRLWRAERLKRLGFHANPDVKETRVLTEQIKLSKKIAPLVAKYQKKFGKKFITLELAKSLAKKFHLVVGKAKQFRAQIPEENLLEMEAFMKIAPAMPRDSTMLVVAPYDNFETAGYVVRDGMLEYDPIVLYPVDGGFLIVTAWGPEAKDPLVTK